MVDPELEAKVRRYWSDVWTEGNVDFLHDFYADQYRENDDVLTPGEFAEGVTRWRTRFPDFAVTVDRLWGWGDGIATRVTYTGTHLGDFTFLPATGAATRSGGLDVFEFVDGRVVQHWHETDHYELFTQLGARVVGPER